MAASTALVSAMAATGPGMLIAGSTLAPYLTAKLTTAEIEALLRATTLGLRRESISAYEHLPIYVSEHYVAARGQRSTPDELRALVIAEQSREAEFRRRQLQRVRTRLAKALAEPPERRRLAIDGVLRREQQFRRQRDKAVVERASGAAEARNVLEVSPQGAVWKLGPREHHCPGCAFLHGQALPWTVLRAQRMIPPLGPGCGCRLRGVAESWLFGDLPELPRVPTVAEAVLIVAHARALGHPHGHDGGVAL